MYACPAPSTQCMIDRGMTCRCDYNKAHRAVPNLQPRDREIFRRPTVFPVPSRFPAVRSVTRPGNPPGSCPWPPPDE